MHGGGRGIVRDADGFKEERLHRSLSSKEAKLRCIPPSPFLFFAQRSERILVWHFNDS